MHVNKTKFERNSCVSPKCHTTSRGGEGGGGGLLPDVIQVCAAPSGGDFAPFWPENGCTLYPFWSGIGCGFRGNYGSV